MSSNYSSGSSNRGGRSRGGRRRSGSSQGRPRSGAPRSEERTPRQPAKKKGLIARILGVFGLGSKKQSSGKPQRTPRTDRPEGASSRREARKPERIEVTTPRVYVGNLSFDATESDLLELFGGVGSVQNVEIVCNRETHRSKGFGFVQLASVEEAKRAVDELHDKEYMGRKMVVSGAKAAPESRGERPSRRDESRDSSESEAAAA
jgi:RNA recognition motif-containing protein